MVFPVLRGILLGSGAVVALGTVVCVGLTVRGWPANGGPESRARHLGEGISDGMNVAFVAGLLVIPAAVVWSVRSHRARS